MNVDPIVKESPKNDHPFSGEKDKEQASPASNGFLIKNSRFMKREIRDHRMIRSPRYDDFVVAKIHDDLIEKLSQEYICSEIHDPLLDESPKIQELVSLVTWKRDVQKEKMRELLKICTNSGRTVQEAAVASDPEVRALYSYCEELQEEIRRLDEQIAHIRNKANSSENWPEPVPFKSDLLPVEPFKKSFLPSSLWAFVSDVAERAQCPIDFVGAGLLVVFSSIIGAGCAIRPWERDDWTVIPNLWGGVVGPPGVKKTPALNAAMVPLAFLERDADSAYKEDKMRDEIEKVEREARKKAEKARIETAVKTENEQEIETAKAALFSLEKEDSSPKWRRYKTNDSTIEKLTELLVENPRGLLVYRDEIVGFLAGLEKEGKEDCRAFYLEGWNGYSSSLVKSDRIKRGTTSCNPCISVLGGIQPSKLRQYLQGALFNLENDGFMQRFQFLVYPDKPTTWQLIDKKPDAEARALVIKIAKVLANTDFLSLGAKIEDDFPIPIFRFSPEAQKFFGLWMQTLENRLIKLSDEGMFAEHLAKYRSLMPSLALISCLIRAAEGQTHSPVCIELEDAERAAALCTYLESHAKRIYSMAEQRGIHAAKALLRKIREGALPEGFTPRDVYRKGWSSLSIVKDVEEACIELVARGWLKEEVVPPTSKGGPSSVKYHAHPNLKKPEDAEAVDE